MPPKVLFSLMLFILLTSPAYAFKVGDFNFKNDVSAYFLDEKDDIHKISYDDNTPYRLEYVGNWRYKNTVFVKTLFREHYSDDLADTNFSKFQTGLGAYFYKKFSLKYQFERKRVHTPSVIKTEYEHRIGVGYDFKKLFFDEKLSFVNNTTLYFWEASSEQRLHFSTILRYQRLFLKNTFYVDYDHEMFGDQEQDFIYFDKVTLGFVVLDAEHFDVSARLQFQKKKDVGEQWRIGMGVAF